MNAPDCYKCTHRGNVPGSAHSSCKHPSAAHLTSGSIGQLISVLTGSRNGAILTPPNNLQILGSEHGKRNGWFNWPFNFDPIWLENCTGFTPKGGEIDAKSNKAPDAGSAPSVLQRNERDEIDERPIT